MMAKFVRIEKALRKLVRAVDAETYKDSSGKRYSSYREGDSIDEIDSAMDGAYRALERKKHP